MGQRRSFFDTASYVRFCQGKQTSAARPDEVKHQIHYWFLRAPLRRGFSYRPNLFHGYKARKRYLRR